MRTPEELTARIRRCRFCRDETSRPPLPHEPRPVVQLSGTARICVAGQAPGTKVHASGRPFDDASGRRLRDWMGIGEDVFYDRSKVVTVPMGFCFPGQDARGADLPPRPECAPKWRDEVFATMPSVELVLAIGMYAQRWHLGARRKQTLTDTVRDWRQHLYSNEHAAVLPMPHPSWRNNAWLRRNPWFEAEVIPALRAQVARLTR